MRVLFVSAALPAHLDWGGYLATAAALARRGHAVLWASGDAVHDAVAGAGVPFAPVEETGFPWPPPPPVRRQDFESQAEFERVRRRRAVLHWLDEERVLAAADALAALATRFMPDLIVSEFFVAAAGIAAERVGAPFAVAGWPAHRSTMESAESRAARAHLQRILRQAGVRGLHFTESGPPALHSGLLHLDYWSETWFRGVPLLPQTRHAGGIAGCAPEPDPTLPLPDDRPWVLITLGTSFNRDTTFHSRAAQAAQALGCVPLIATGPLPAAEAAALADQLPAGCVVRERVDFAAILPWTAAAMQHGGAGTTHALVTHGVPQVVIPHAGDQMRQALGVQRSGVGLAIQPGAATVDTLRRALAAILPDRSPARAAAQRLREEFAALGGVPRAAGMLEECAERAATEVNRFTGGGA